MQYFGIIVSEEKEVIIMQMYEVTALAPEGSEEVYQAVIFAEDGLMPKDQLEGQLPGSEVTMNVHGRRSVKCEKNF